MPVGIVCSSLYNLYMKTGVIGIDEVGRGPFAGPVTLCAVYIKDTKVIKRDIFAGKIKDSKKIPKNRRNEIYLSVVKNKEIKTEVVYVISSKSASYIDKHGISKAIKSCLVSCVEGLIKKGVNIYDLKINLDAGLSIPLEGLKQKNFVKGDENFTEIAIASILAKEWRDDHMKKLSKKHGEYFWDKNAGYGTLEHRNAIKKFGITKYHRKSYLKSFNLSDLKD